MTIDCEVHDEAVMEVGRLQRRVAELEAALRPLARACSTEFGIDETEPDDSSVYAGGIDGQGITFGLIRNALSSLGQLD